MDREFGEEIQKIITSTGQFSEVIPEVGLGASEDCTYFMDRVQEKGGKAVYMMCGANIAAGHHNSKFDFTEKNLVNASATLATLAQVFTNK